MAADTREKLHEMMVKTLLDQNRHHNWFYRAVRPMPVPPRYEPGGVVRGDCSKGVQYLCRWAGAPDPMGNGWADWGNSSTICMHLTHLSSASDLEVGDIVTFGPGGDEHAAMVMVPGRDPLLWSDGHQGAPNTYRLSADRRVRQFLRLPVPHPAPTPAQKLRAKTGYFAWVAWKLGEGEWRHYKGANKSVRPNVPKIIPLAWWKRYMLFLKNRKNGDKSTTKGIEEA